MKQKKEKENERIVKKYKILQNASSQYTPSVTIDAKSIKIDEP